MAVPTNPDVCLPTALPSMVDPVVESAPVLFSHALSSSAASPAVTGAAGGCANIDVRPSVDAGLVGETTNFLSGLRSLVQPHASADQPDSFLSTPGQTNSKEKNPQAASRSGRERSLRLFLVR